MHGETVKKKNDTVCGNKMCTYQLPAEVLGTLPSKPYTLKKRVRKVINEVN
jgi:hypothetical protein